MQRQNKKTGLILGGGAMRGMYTAGVLDVFLDHKIEVGGVIGISAGAVFGVNLLSGQRGRVIRYNKRFNRDKNYMGIGPFLRTGNIVNTEYAYHVVPRELDKFDDEAYKRSGIPFYAGVTSLETGRAEYIKIDSVFEQMDALRASASMPFVSRPVAWNGRHYLDGDIAGSIPYQTMFDMGYDRLVVVLTRERGYRKKPVSPAMIRLYYGKHREFADALMRRHEKYNDSVRELEALEQQGRVLLIAPSEPITIGRIEKNGDKLQEVYELGIRDGVEATKVWKDFKKIK